MASHPPGRCCTVGIKHEGEARGELRDIGDTSTYFSYPEDKSAKHAILILTDVIGHKSINAQLIADQFAANGYVAIMPDLFHNDPVALNRPDGFDIQKWRSKHSTDRVDPVVESVVSHIHAELGITRIGAVGYCFGAKYVARFLAPHRGVSVGYMAHPSFVDINELKGMQGPLCIAAAETDEIFPAEKRRETENLLKESGNVYQISLFSGVSHGFATRGDIRVKKVRWAKEEAFGMAVRWFGEFLVEE